MNKKLVFRILGALASALIIVSVFVPFVSVTGYTTSLWESFEVANSLYLPIMIIVFGVIGVVFFALNIKTEFAYMSTGAITFFLVVETVDIINQGTFDTLSIGYYFLAVGALLTGIMAFLTNLKSNKKKEEVIEVAQSPETSMLDQIDKLYNDQPSLQSEISPIQPVNNVVEPIPVQPEVVPVQPIEQVTPIVQKQPVPEVVPVSPQPVPTVEPIQSTVTPMEAQPVNPVVQEFSTPQVNPQPMIQEQPTVVPQPAPIVEPVQSAVAPMEAQPVNPVVQEFTNPTSTVAPQSTNELDIFGQPINK